MSSDNPFPEYPENPYASGEQFRRKPELIELPHGQQRGKVSQVPTLGILMMVFGGLLLLLGLGTLSIGLLPVAFLENQFRNNPAFQNNPGLPPPQQLKLVYSIIGGSVLVLSLLILISGFRVYRYRGRVLAFVALTLSLATVVTCWCFPVSLALFIFGLVVLLNDPVKTAFELGAAGYSSAEIQNAFARLPLT